MEQRDRQLLVRDLRTGRLSRREVITRLGALGVSAAGIASVLTAAAPRTAHAAAAVTRGSQGTLKLLYWQAPTILNPHLSQGTKDFHAARICCEPLLTADAALNFTPVLAANVPSRANGQVAADGKSVIYKLKQGVKWADGRPFTSDDVAFTYQYVANKQTAATTYGTYANIAKVEPQGPYAVKITFKAPTPGWYVPFVGQNGGVVPRHALDAYVGSNARNAPFNFKSFGTGPYMVESFKPGDLVVYTVNPYYREPNKPAFSRVELKGGGDAASAARAVLQTGEYDYAWNLLVEWPVLQDIARGGRGQIITGPGGGVEQVYCNMADPNKEVEGQRASLKAPHPFLTDVKVRQALALATDRQTIAQQLFGGEGEATANTLTIPTIYASKNTKMVYDLARANQLLDEAGYQRGPDGIRQKGGVRLQVVFQTSVNSLRQKEQEIIKASWEKIGVATTLKSIDAGVFFSSSPGNTDTYSHFYADIQMYTTQCDPFPNSYMGRFYSGNPAVDVCQKENDWSGLNFTRYVDKTYNALFDQVQAELDPKKSIALWIKLNDRLIDQAVTIPLIDRKNVSARANTLDVGQNMLPFDDETLNIADWKRTQ
ncbi:MAG TPA: peptide ABC transporter substrate-binding protein [bacterium]|nr:peptide ABC transporter substrate-binding protein [bacterium]